MIKDTGHKKWLQVPLVLIVKLTLKTIVAVQTPYNKVPNLIYYYTNFFSILFISIKDVCLCVTPK